MSLQVEDQVEGIDLAVAAYRVGGQWRLDELNDTALLDLDTLIAALRRLPGEAGTLGMLAIDEDFFLLVRVAGSSVRLLLSDVTAAEEWELAQEVVDRLGLPHPDDDEGAAPAGDLGIVSDLGMPADDMGELLDDVELLPDEMLSDIADALGFGDAFDEAAEIEPAEITESSGE